MNIRLLLINFMLVITIQPSSLMGVQDGESCHNASVLSDRILSQMEIFARIATAVQFFYPGDEAKATDWEAFVASAMREIAEASSDDDSKILRRIFAGVAPALRINGERCAQESEFVSEKMIVWVQNGYIEEPDYDPEKSAYKRERVVIAASEGAEIAPYVTTYGDVAIEMPLAVYVDEKERSFPRVATLPAYDKMPEDLNDSYVCLSAATKVWGVFRHYFPYFDTIKVDWDGELPKLLLACKSGSEKHFFNTLRRSLTRFQDNHINLMNHSRDLPLYTVPVAFDLVQNSLTVIYKAEDDRSVISIADELIAIDGVSARELLSEKTLCSLRSDHRSDSEVALNYLIRREKDENVTLTLKNRAGELYSAVLKSSHHYGDISWPAEKAYSFEDMPLTQLVESGIHYVNLSKIKACDVKQIIEKLKDAKALVLDLRNYPVDFMGWWNFLSHVSTANLSSLPMFYHIPMAPDQKRTEIMAVPQEIEPASPQLSIPAVALSSKFSMSQNEHALGFIQSAKIPVVGERTFGINGNWTYIHFMGGYKSKEGFSVTFTGMELKQHDSSALIGVGIIPDIEVNRTVKGLRQGNDELLETAVSILRKEIKDQM
ncbi:MAG: hypothetical protein H6618_00440 [Deltaproteobacteria bacterium]|nr:hypothetical protein [Deltaproteobacteria bacterium]